MIGYIYKTTIKNKESSLDGFFYIGKRQKEKLRQRAIEQWKHQK